LILSRRQLERVLRIYVEHYNRHRPHRDLGLKRLSTRRLADSRSSPVGLERRNLLAGLLHEYALAA
jgi:putative transposase